jgi:hypothetical protein
VSDYEAMRRAQEVIDAADRGGEYDERLGITPEQRGLFNRVDNGERVTVADMEALRAMGRDDLIVTAYDNDLIDLNHEGN